MPDISCLANSYCFESQNFWLTPSWLANFSRPEINQSKGITSRRHWWHNSLASHISVAEIISSTNLIVSAYLRLNCYSDAISCSPFSVFWTNGRSLMENVHFWKWSHNSSLLPSNPFEPSSTTRTFVCSKSSRNLAPPKIWKFRHIR